jgi:phage shock protein B
LQRYFIIEEGEETSAMKEVLIVAIVFGSIVIMLALIPGTILLAIKLFKGGFSRTDQQQQAEETKIIQQIYQGLSRMEERIEALETILLDRDKEGHKR